MKERWIPDALKEEFYELSGKFLSDGYNIESADDLATVMMCSKYRSFKEKDFLPLRKAAPASIKKEGVQ